MYTHASYTRQYTRTRRPAPHTHAPCSYPASYPCIHTLRTYMHTRPCMHALALHACGTLTHAHETPIHTRAMKLYARATHLYAHTPQHAHMLTSSDTHVTRPNIRTGSFTDASRPYMPLQTRTMPIYACATILQRLRPCTRQQHSVDMHVHA